MKTGFAVWVNWMLAAAIGLATLYAAYRLANAALGRRMQRKRIVAARVRSGHAPLGVPTALGDLPDSAGSGPRANAGNAPSFVVDEQPTIRIRYIDPYGKQAESTIEVERLDLHRRAIVARGNSLYDARSYPLDRIVEARNVQTGKPFNVGLWVDAVRVARRRRDASTDMSSVTQWG